MYYGEIRKISVFLFGKSALYRAMNIYGNINFNALGKISADNILFFVFFFIILPRKQDSKFHANCLQWRQENYHQFFFC